MINANIDSTYELETKTLRLTLSGEIDHHTAGRLRECADRELAVRRPAKLVLALDGVTFMDSAGLGYILGRYGKAQTLGAELEVTGASAQIMRILRLSGADKLIKIYPAGTNKIAN